jgi:hypothetical protein
MLQSTRCRLPDDVYDSALATIRTAGPHSNACLVLSLWHEPFDASTMRATRQHAAWMRPELMSIRMGGCAKVTTQFEILVGKDGAKWAL